MRRDVGSEMLGLKQAVDGGEIWSSRFPGAGLGAEVEARWTRDGGVRKRRGT